MRISSLAIRSFLVALIFTLFSSLEVLAQENIISSVVISKAKDNVNTYELNIDSTETVQYKSHIDSDNNVVFELKNSTLAPDLGTIYDDVSNVDNVTVQQLDHNRVRIFVSGKDVRKTDLVFVNSLFDTSKDISKRVTINRPISEYKSTASEMDLENQEDIQEWDDNSFNLTHLTTSVLSDLRNGASGKVLIFLLGLIILSVFVKSLASKISQEKEPLIGLNNQKYLDNNYKIGQVELSNKLSEDLPSVADRNETLRKAQLELQKAHQKYQQYIQNKYQTTSIPKTKESASLNQTMAINQYQRSTQNPYKNQEVIRINKRNSNSLNNINVDFNKQQRPKTMQRQEFSSPYIQRTNKFVKPEIQQEKSGTNMKFLESVTKIYERSGRGDLADGLKNSISKAKQTTY